MSNNELSTLTPNQEAIAQEDIIAIPRNLYLWDTINFTISGVTLTQGFTATSDNTILQLMNQIDTLPNVWVSAYLPITKTITIKSKIPWTSFPNPSLFLSSSFDSVNQIPSQSAIQKITEYNFPRTLVPGDTISTIVNGSPYSVNYAIWSSETVQALSDMLNSSLSWTINITNTSNQITLTAIVARTPFTTQPLQIVNTLTPKVLVANIVPTKQRELLTLQQDIVVWDSINVTIDWTSITQVFDTDETTTLNALNSQIEALPNVTSSVDVSSRTFSIDAQDAWVPFTMTSLVTSWVPFTSSGVIVNQTWSKATLWIILDSVLAPTWTAIVWDCTINFVSSWWNYDFDCADNIASIDTYSTNTTDIATLMSSIKHISDLTWTRLLNVVSSWTNIVYTTSWAEVSTSLINVDLNSSSNISFDYNSIPVLDIAQIDTLTLPRDLVQGDTFQTNIDWITVTQNYLTSSWVSFDNLVNQINNLPNISATWASNIITITADIAWTQFIVWQATITNTTNPSLTITNVVAQAQKSEIDFPASFVPWDVINITIDWTNVTANFDANNTITLNSLINSITSTTTTNASLSWSLGIVLEAKIPGNTFTVDKVEIKNIAQINPVQDSVPWIAQVDTLNVPFIPTTWDTLSFLLNSTTINQDFISDAFTTFASLNTKLDELPVVSSSVDANLWNFTITSEIAWTPFSVSLLATWAVITSSNSIPNTDSWAQVDSLVISRNITSWDLLNIDIAWNTWSIPFNTDKTTTLQNLTTYIDLLAEVDATYDNIDTITITSSTPWIAFAGWVLAILTTYTSVNQTPNVPAQAQIDSITIPRNLIIGDKLTIDIEWINIVDTFSWTSAWTLDNFASLINSQQSRATATISWNDIIFTANLAWIPFTISTWSFIIENSSFATTSVPNVTAVKQESEFEIPVLVPGDNVTFSVNSNIVSLDYAVDSNSTINEVINSINSFWEVTADYLSWTTIHMISNVAWVPFTISQVLIRNTTVSNITVPNVVPVAQIVNMYPAWTLREWITFRVSVDWADYDYLTLPTDWISEIVTGVSSVITNTWIIISTSFQNSFVWQTLSIFRSTDWITNWEVNYPNSTCVVSSSNICTFETNHLTYFSFATITSNTITIVIPPVIPVSSWAGGWGAWISKDYCPSWDYSPSYYDNTCWSSTTWTLTWTWTSTTWTGVNIPEIITPNAIEQLAIKYILEIKKNNYETAGTIDQKISIWQKTIDAINNKLKDSTSSDSKKELLNSVKDKAVNIKNTLIQEKEAQNKVIDWTWVDEEYIPSQETITDTVWNVSFFKYIEVEHVVIVRDFPSYKWEIVDYLPRNFRVEVIGVSNLWDKIKYSNWKIAYIRNSYLRDQNRQDRWRTASIMVFFNTSLQADVDMRKIKVAHSLNVRKWPGVDYDVNEILPNWEKVLILDAKAINGWYEIRWNWWTGWVNSKYTEEMK